VPDHPQPDPDPAAAAEAFEQLFGALYLQFHRRDGKHAELSGASRAVLQHLAMTGPLTVGEAAVHLDRAQSVVSDLVTQLEGNGLLEREPDPGDRRRTLVWLTPQGQERLARDRQVLSAELLTHAMSGLPTDQRRTLLDGLRALLAVSPTAGPHAAGASPSTWKDLR
jgi:DNA-binding MarR family transcriptional regulator